jgi:hypothetical protein
MLFYQWNTLWSRVLQRVFGACRKHRRIDVKPLSSTMMLCEKCGWAFDVFEWNRRVRGPSFNFYAQEWED